MRVLVDTNILTRAAQATHPQHDEASRAVAVMTRRKIAPQNLYEFWVVCTRPVGENGLGMDIGLALERLNELKIAFDVLEETPAFRPTWESLIVQYEVKGKAAHDARLVAAMKVHGISQLLTFNRQHFARYPGLTVMAPVEALAGEVRAE